MKNKTWKTIYDCPEDELIRHAKVQSSDDKTEKLNNILIVGKQNTFAKSRCELQVRYFIAFS